jgi:hypothetical protein
VCILEWLFYFVTIEIISPAATYFSAVIFKSMVFSAVVFLWSLGIYSLQPKKPA